MAKDQLNAKYLGRSGVHGLGLRRSTNELIVYADGLPQSVLAEMEAMARPYRVTVVNEQAPKLSFNP